MNSMASKMPGGVRQGSLRNDAIVETFVREKHACAEHSACARPKVGFADTSVRSQALPRDVIVSRALTVCYEDMRARTFSN